MLFLAVDQAGQFKRVRIVVELLCFEQTRTFSTKIQGQSHHNILAVSAVVSWFDVADGCCCPAGQVPTDSADLSHC